MFHNRYSWYSYFVILIISFAHTAQDDFLSEQSLFYDTEDVEILLKQNGEKSCEIENFLAHWLYYHETWSQAYEYNEGLLENPACGLYHTHARILKAQLLQKKQNWNQGVFALNPLILEKKTPFYQRALSLTESLFKSRIRSVHDLSPQEECLIENQKQLLERAHHAQVEGSLQLMILTDCALTDFEQKVILEHFSHNQNIDKIQIVLREDVIQKDILELAKDHYILTLHLKKPLEQLWFITSKGTLQTQPEFFKKHRKNDFLMMNHTWSYTLSLLYDSNPIVPYYIFYNPKELPADYVHLLKALPQAYYIDPFSPDLGISALVNQPQRDMLFRKILPDSKYISQPATLPYGLAFLGGARNGELLYQYLSKFYTKNIFFSLYPPGQKKQNMPALYLYDSDINFEEKELYDWMNILCKLSVFLEDPVAFHQGELGLYLAQNQMIRIRKEWRTLVIESSSAHISLKS